jgi:hypothetical protein
MAIPFLPVRVYPVIPCPENAKETDGKYPSPNPDRTRPLWTTELAKKIPALARRKHREHRTDTDALSENLRTFRLSSQSSLAPLNRCVANSFLIEVERIPWTNRSRSLQYASQTGGTETGNGSCRWAVSP